MATHLLDHYSHRTLCGMGLLDALQLGEQVTETISECDCPTCSAGDALRRSRIQISKDHARARQQAALFSRACRRKKWRVRK